MLDDERVRVETPPIATSGLPGVTGSDLGRLLALSDGIFAFSMTLLVLALIPPTGLGSAQLVAFLTARDFGTKVLVYLLGFFVTGFYWLGHHRIFGLIRKHDDVLLRLNMVLLAFVVLVPFATVVLEDAPATELAVSVYALIQSGAGLSLLGVWWYAFRSRRLTAPNLPESWVRYTTFRVAVAPLVFLTSLPIAHFNPPIASYFWASVFVLTSLRFRVIRSRFFPGIPG